MANLALHSQPLSFADDLDDFSHAEHYPKLSDTCQGQSRPRCGNQPLTTKVTGDSCAWMKLDHARTFYTDEEFSRASLLLPKLLLNLILDTYNPPLPPLSECTRSGRTSKAKRWRAPTPEKPMADPPARNTTPNSWTCAPPTPTPKASLRNGNARRGPQVKGVRPGKLQAGSAKATPRSRSGKNYSGSCTVRSFNL